MRKASQDGGDNTSITSGIENEFKKSGAGILKSTKNSIKRKVQKLSTESDDTANEPLLHKNKEKSEIEKQSAKFLISKTKTDCASEKSTDKDKLLADENNTKPSITDVTGITDTLIENGLKDQKHVTSPSISSVPIHNHMHTNVFNNPDGPKTTTIAKTQILVELDTSKPSRYNPSPLIFTTAKIHTEGKIQQMEPVQVTPVPILSTIEGGLVKTGTIVKEFDSKEKKDTTFIPVTQVATISKLPEKHDVNEILKENAASNESTKGLITDNKGKISTLTQNVSEFMDSKCTDFHSLSNKITTEESLRTKPSQPLNNMGARSSETTINIRDSPASNTNDFATSVKKKITTASIEPTSTAAKSNVDINKNFQSPTDLGSVVKIEDKKPDSRATSSLPVSNTSSTKVSDSASSTKGEKIMTNSTTNAKESKLDNNLENKAAISNVKSFIEKEAVNKTKTASTAQSSTETIISTNKISDAKSPESDNYRTESTPSTTKFSVSKLPDKEQIATVKNASTTSEILSANKINANKSSEYNAFKKDTALPVKSMSNTTKSSIIKTPDKEQSFLNVKTTASGKPIESQSTTKINNVKSQENGISKKVSTTSSSISNTASVENKVPSTSISKTTGKEPTLKSSSELKTVSNVKSVPITSNTKSAVTTPVSNSLQIMPSETTAATIHKTSTTNVTNVSTTPTTSINKTAVWSGQSSITASVNIKISTNISPMLMTTADNISSKYKSNNVATVVSSISKSTSTASSTSPTSNTMTTTKSPSTIKQSTSASTVKTISSIPTAKSSIVSTVPQDKKSIKAAPNPNNDAVLSVSNTKSASSTTKKQSTAKETATSTSSTKGVSVTSTKPAVKSSTQNETKRSEDARGSKA